jgi:hypothetical protein
MAIIGGKNKKTAQQATNGTKEFALLLTVYSRKGKKSTENEGKFAILHNVFSLFISQQRAGRLATYN